MKKNKFIPIAILTILAILVLLEHYEKKSSLSKKPGFYPFGFDLKNKIIVYNGKYIDINNGILKIENYTFHVETTNTKLSIGKKYMVNFQGEIFRMFYTELPILDIKTGKIKKKYSQCKLYLLEKEEKVSFYFAGLKIRGTVSRKFPKKSYNMELWKDEYGNDTEKKSLLGMRSDDDWMLDGMWNEPLRIRDFTSQTIWLEIGRVQGKSKNAKIGIARKYCDLFLNGKYRGLYYLGEKIDRKQLGLKKYKTQMEGELYKSYKYANGTTYTEVDSFDNNTLTWSGYEPKYPKGIGKVDWANLHNFIDFTVNSTPFDFKKEVSSKIDLENMMDYYIFRNLSSSNISGKNWYTGKYSKSSLYFFLPWDIDGSFGNNWNREKKTLVENMSNPLFDKLLNFSDFRIGVKERWSELRKNKLDTLRLLKLFKDNYEYLDRNGAYTREALIPSKIKYHSNTDFDYLESWIKSRVNFLDSYFEDL